MDFYGFYTGKIFDAYKYLGAHTEKDGVVFRTFAPSASKISVIGEFNDWEEIPMEKVHDGNFWEFSTKKARPGMMYKYRIYDQSGQFIDHCDPYGCLPFPRLRLDEETYGQAQRSPEYLRDPLRLLQKALRRTGRMV